MSVAITKRVKFDASETKDTVFDEASVRRNDRGASDLADLPLPYVVTRTVEATRVSDGRSSRRIEAVGFFRSRTTADRVARLLNDNS